MEYDVIWKPHPKLPVFRAAGRCFQLLWARRRDLLAPFLALLVMNLCMRDLEAGLIHNSWPGFVDKFLMLLAFLSSLLVNLSFSVGLYRAVLLQEPRTGLGYFCWDAHLLNALWALVKVSLCTFTVAVGLGMASGLVIHFLIRGGAAGSKLALVLLILAIGLPLLGVVMRLSMAVVAEAIGDTFSQGALKRSWNVTRDNVLRLYGTCFVLAILFMVFSLIGRVLATGGLFVNPAQDGGVLTAFILPAIGISFMHLLGAAMVSLCFDYLASDGRLMRQ